jgi:hypothetical protein
MGMDVFLSTFLSAAGEAGIATATVTRHLRIFRRCVEHDDAVVLVTRAHHTDHPHGPEFILLLTARRLVVTQESRVLHKLRLHLNAELRHLANVTWHPDPRLSAIELAATAIDGIRERFWIRAGRPRQMWHLDALFTHLFRIRTYARRAGDPAPYVTFADHLVRA